jgi:hypothetical protein
VPGTETETVAQFLQQVWPPSKQGRVETSSFDQYTWAVRRHIVPLIGAVRLSDLTAEVADEWVSALTGVNKAGKPRLGATSARLVRKVLSMALEEAVQRGRLGRNPVVLTQPPKLDRASKKLGWTSRKGRGSSTSRLSIASTRPFTCAWSRGCTSEIQRLVISRATRVSRSTSDRVPQ